MKITIAVIAAVVIVALGGLCYLDRPKLVVIDTTMPANFPEDKFSHELFESLLKKHVSDGRVDYDDWHRSKSDIESLNSYLTAVARYSPENSPQRFKTRPDQLAYWLYAYNAIVIKGILDRWPIESVTDVNAPIEIVKGFGFFYQHRYLFGEKPYSLYAIENSKIRAGHKDARIHFVLNCGSESCPIIRPELPDGSELEAFLQRAAIDFVDDDRNVRVDHATQQIILSDIFKWYEKDFINDLRYRGLPTDNGLLGYVASIASEPKREELLGSTGYKTIFEDYDWSVNQADTN